jgi:alcohol dehydrogenase (cytochrome c)
MRTIGLVLAGLLLTGVGLVAAVPTLRWRAQIVTLNVTGGIPHIDWNELLPLLSPSASHSLAPLLESRNPYAVIRNPVASRAEIEAGARDFSTQCASCHGPDASGGTVAPALVGRPLKHGSSDWALYRTIRDGVAGTGMPAHASLSATQVWQIAAFVRALEASARSEGALTGPEIEQPVQVSFDELKGVVHPGRDWLMYSGSYSGQRHSTLSRIDTGNVRQLGLRWVAQLEGDLDMVQCSPLIRDGIMFFTLPPGTVLALDARTGRRIWKFEASPAPPRKQFLGTSVNRGVAILGDQLFVGTWDARLLSLSAKTGKLLWETRVEEKDWHWISAAPLVVHDLVIIGTGFKQGHGVLRAYDVKTGQPRWTFDAVAQPGDPNHASWPGDTWQEGGAATWMTGTYDPQLDLLFWGIGNPKPDYDASIRRGDNLYTNSVVALNASTGKLVWYFQFTPGDDHDWDSNQVPVLADLPGPSGTRKLLLLANRNGFYYILDRATGQFVKAQPFAQQNWTASISAAGRPVPLPPSEADQKGRLVFPSNLGATNWWPPTFDPDLKLMFVPVFEHGMVFFQSGNSFPTDSNRPFYSAVRAINADSGEVVWEHKQTPRQGIRAVGGVLSTQGGLVFGGDANLFFALGARTGEALWSVDTGGHIAAAPVSYEAGGEQFIAIAAGRDLLAFALPQAPARALNAALGAAAPAAGFKAGR